MKPTPSDIDKKEEVRWSLSWQPDGRCDRFTKEAILACAPQKSGVYGLFNFDCQIFIGESENIQEALLRHESDTDFNSRHLQPTGFTFEPCAAELRQTKAEELIARFCPVLQTNVDLTETSSPSADPTVSEMLLDREMVETPAEHLEFPVQERDQNPNVRPRFQLTRTRGITLVAMFVACAGVIGYLALAGGRNEKNRANDPADTTPGAQSATQSLASGRSENNSVSKKPVSIEKAGTRANGGAAPTKPVVRASASAANVVVRPAAQNATREPVPGVRAPVEVAKTAPTSRSTGSADRNKKWSVQVSAAPAKDIANSLVEQLKAKGYDGYVVQTNVKGQTYYRVRVGRFDGRQEAEAVRQSLARQEGYRDAYLAGD